MKRIIRSGRPGSRTTLRYRSGSWTFGNPYSFSGIKSFSSSMIFSPSAFLARAFFNNNCWSYH